MVAPSVRMVLPIGLTLVPFNPFIGAANPVTGHGEGGGVVQRANVP